MRREVETRDLKAELKKSSQAKASMTACALEVDCRNCLNKGYIIETKGAFAHAELCKCVRECSRCYGKATQSISGYVKPCREISPLKLVTLINDALIPARYAWASFGGFSNFTGSGQQVLKAMQNWTKSYQQQKSRGLLISGAVGIGKTYLLAATALELVQKGIAVRFVDFFQLLSELRAGYTDGKADKTLLEPLIQTEVLIIDELGKGRNVDWEQTILDQLVNGRYNQGKPIVASTNYKLEKVQDEIVQNQFNIDLERQAQGPNNSLAGKFDPNFFGSLENRVGSRIYSRLWEACDKLNFQGENFRLRHLKQS